MSTVRDPDLIRLATIMARLRAPDGCPWDREQSLETLRHYLLEEAHEVLEVMTSDDVAAHCEELGDLLLQIAFQAQLRSETGAFDLADVVQSISDKMVRRHPHVFGDESAADASAVMDRWEQIKRAEGKAHGPAAVSEALPALMRAEKVGAKAAKVGFDWPDVSGPLAKVHEELAELTAEMTNSSEDRGAERPLTTKSAHSAQSLPDANAQRVHEELGDLLFAVVNVARHLGVRPELALHDATRRFTARFAEVEAGLAAEGRSVADTSAAELDVRWERAKTELS